MDGLPGHTSLMQRYQLGPQLSQQTLCLPQEAMLERDLFYSHRPTGDMCSLKQAVFRRGFPIWLEFFDGTIELQLIPQLSGAGLSLQIDGLLESAFTHAYKHTYTHTRAR